jgi:hypothetical protein
MKKLFIAAMMLFSLSMISQAQSVVRTGNIFKQVSNSSRSSKADTLLTSFKFEDSKGTLYPIIVNRQSGRCWIWRKSGKTGKMYKSYLPEDVCKSVCREYSITYVPKKAK